MAQSLRGLAGLRVYLGFSMIDKPVVDSWPFVEESFAPDVLQWLRGLPRPRGDMLLDLVRDIAKTRHPNSSRVGVIVAPSAPQRCTDDFLALPRTRRPARSADHRSCSRDADAGRDGRAVRQEHGRASRWARLSRAQDGARARRVAVAARPGTHCGVRRQRSVQSLEQRVDRFGRCGFSRAARRRHQCQHGIGRLRRYLHVLDAVDVEIRRRDRPHTHDRLSRVADGGRDLECRDDRRSARARARAGARASRSRIQGRSRLLP